MQIEALIRELEPDPVLDRAELVADVELTGGLDAGKDAGHRRQATHPERAQQDAVALNLVDRAKARPSAAAEFLPRSPRPATSGWTLKGRHDFVTEVDATPNGSLRRSCWPASGGGRIVGEELSPELATEGLVWVVDPLDGTTNFLHGYPAYAVSIAAAVDGVLMAGVVHHVPQDQVSWAARGVGAWCRDQRLRSRR